MAYNRIMVIVETSVFTRRIIELMPDDDYRALQLALVVCPDAGDIVRGGGGIRKLRWGLPGRGKRGGVRIIYYWAVSQDQILLLLVYPKNETDDLSDQQLKVLRQVVAQEFP